MPEVIEVEQIDAADVNASEPVWDSWVVPVPEQIVKAQNLAEGAMAVITIEPGGVKAEIIGLTDDLRSVSKRIMEKRQDVYKELKALGD